MSDIKRPKPNYVAVLTHNSTDGEIEQQRIIDHNRHEDRVWLGKHSFWAMRNSKAITTVPVTNHDSELPEWV
jgi:hypothetical protein